MKKVKVNPKYFRLLVSVSILVWVFVIIAVLLVLQLRGNLKPHAADDVDLLVNAGGRVIDLNEVGVGFAKMTFENASRRQYVFSDSLGRFFVSNLAPGEYSVIIEAPGYKRFESTVELKSSDDYNFTLHQESTKND